MNLAGIEKEGQPDSKFQYNGQEKQEEFGLSWSHYRYRFSDYQLGRFHSVDPIAEDYYYLTPYQFASNNPSSKIEIEGLEGDWAVEANDFMHGLGFGFGNSVVNTIKSGQKAVTDPIGTLSGFASALADPIGTLKGAANQFIEGVDKLVNGSSFEKGEVLGGFFGDLTQEAATGSGFIGKTAKVGEKGKDFVFRTSNESPDKVFKDGFTANGTNDNLLDHVKGDKRDSKYIPTSKDPSAARDFIEDDNSFLYTIRRPENGIDVNQTMGNKSPFPEEKEIAVPNKIFPEQIMGGRRGRVDQKLQGPFIKNPNYKK